MSLSSHQRPHRGATDVWLTPPELLQRLGRFDLDPCAAPEPRPWPTAARHYVEADDGLTAPWWGLVWLNPPYGDQAALWLARLADHDAGGVALVPARTETGWFREQVWAKAAAVLFLHRRPHFHHPDGRRARFNSGAPMCLVAYGSRAVYRLADSGLEGALARGWLFTA
ncbi:DNA N-6-adenine-methyltransferase [Dactylosporangium sp. CS-033363]|uniref:DNA N-6-adenine-methyltransferase n=1 Tax=Dactylosporangium sp. CS-033363 TaxID=3239935 RepID=UPI003D8F13A6